MSSFGMCWLLCHACESFLVVLNVNLCVYELSKPCKHLSYSCTKSWTFPHKCHHDHLKSYLKCRTCHFLLWDSHTEGNFLFFLSWSKMSWCWSILSVLSLLQVNKKSIFLAYLAIFPKIFPTGQLNCTEPWLNCALHSLNSEFFDLNSWNCIVHSHYPLR